MSSTLISPLFSLLYRRPDLVLEHGQLYAQLIEHEARSTGKSWALRVALMALSGCFLLIAVTLTGVSVTLGLTDMTQWSWALFASPIGAFLLSILMWVLSRFQRRNPVSNVMDQMRQDWALFKALSSPNA